MTETATHNLPCAAEGLTSYRYVGPYGYIMIGASDTKSALGEARRSLEDARPDVAQLEIWDGSKYVRVQPVKVGHEHCQICGRHIKAKLGLIAHHGYKRPGQGWQTSSCMGARYRCYEVAHDILDLAIIHCTSALERAVDLFAEFMTNPPQGLEWESKDRYSGQYRKWGYPRSVLRTAIDVNQDHFETSWRADDEPSYGHLFKTVRNQHISTIRHTTMTLEFLKQRRADWKAPHG